MKPPKNLVYSTDPLLQQRIKTTMPQNGAGVGSLHQDPRDGIIRIHRETKGRGGKGVSVITGLALGETELNELAKKLKQHCGTGGTVKNGTIEIQGDQREKIKQWLEKLGHHVKLAGA
jgi:translation initiation factor 1